MNVPMNTNMMNMNMMGMMNPNNMPMGQMGMQPMGMQPMVMPTMGMGQMGMNNMNYINYMNMMKMQAGNNMNNNTIMRLSKEYQLCNQDDELKQIGCSFGLINENDLFKWRVTILGPKDTPYEGGLFTVNIFFPNNYPKMGAEFRFVNKIYHLNVDWRERRDDGKPGDGHICLTSLNEWASTGKVKGKKGYGVKQALFDIFYLFFTQGIESPYDNNLAALYNRDKKQFNENARKWTKLYAQC